jgi:NAD(P)-dependent dehydrogenase (short-subunit alcohol dehydrogenase family)
VRHYKRTSKGLIPLIIEITDEPTISAAVDAVANDVGERGLVGLVNNAGIVKPAPLEFQPLADFRMQLEVNLIGHVVVTQAFLPLIRRGHGRIVNVGSIGGRLAMPLHGAYRASKFGMEAISDVLRLELRQWGIHVSHVDPGATETAIFDKELAEIDRVQQALREQGRSLYDAQLAATRKLVEETAADTAPALDLAKVIAHALSRASRRPGTWRVGARRKSSRSPAWRTTARRTWRSPTRWACRSRRGSGADSAGVAAGTPDGAIGDAVDEGPRLRGELRLKVGRGQLDPEEVPRPAEEHEGEPGHRRGSAWPPTTAGTSGPACWSSATTLGSRRRSGRNHPPELLVVYGSHRSSGEAAPGAC